MKKNYTISIPVGLFWKVYVPAALVLCGVGFLVGLLVVDKLVMPNIVGVNRGMVEVPNIEGLPYEEGRHKLYGVGLLTEVRDKEFDDSIQDGSIINQYPESGSKVKKGRKVAATVSRGKEIAAIPRVKQLSERQARIEFRKYGFTLGKVKKKYSSSYPEDIVIDAYPPGGTTISRSMEVDLIVSRGSRPTHATVPNIVGESLAEAEKQIKESGLKVGKITYQNSSSLVPGTIISQSVSPGAKAPLDSHVNMVVSVIR
ncbi:MAG: PASTA domain-containing protein [Chitinispirillaceae bacterium]